MIGGVGYLFQSFFLSAVLSVFFFTSLFSGEGEEWDLKPKANQTKPKPQV